jgi:HK97 family phage major capsid protein
MNDRLAAALSPGIRLRLLSGRPVAIASAMPANQALMGSFSRAGRLYWRGGVRLDANNGHADFFTRNLIALRAEVRVALVIWRPAAFGLVSGPGT